MRIIPIIVLISACLLFRAWAQEDDNFMPTTSALQSVLTNLKESAEKLSQDNQRLSARDNGIKEQIAALQGELGRLQAKNDSLDRSMAQLEGKNSGRSGVVTRLEQENDSLDERTLKAETNIKMINQALEAGYKEDQRLLLQLKDMSEHILQPPQSAPADSQDLARLKLEKLKLMKMIYDSQQHQAALRAQLMGQQKNSSSAPVLAALQRQEMLKSQIRLVEAQIAANPPENFSLQRSDNDQWDDSQLRQLQEELRILEKNYAQLKDLFAQMSRKAHSGKLSGEERSEAAKLQGNVDELNRQGTGLKSNLDDLRSQMVELDKRKSHLEGLVRQLP